jgi:hypothetical protein
MKEPHTPSVKDRKSRKDQLNGANLIEESAMPFSRTTCWRLRKAGKLRCYRIGRRLYYDKKHLEQLLEECEAV